MSTFVDIPTLERMAFFDGQRLGAKDLEKVQTFHRQLRWLHNRSLHTWGIALGLDVSGERGDRMVTIRPGYALDCQGRELVLSQALQMPVPAIAGTRDGSAVEYYLTASYAEDRDLAVSETREGVCQGKGAVRRTEAPRIRWQDPNDTSPESVYRRGLDVIFARIEVKNCQLDEPVSMDERRNALPSEQPYIAAGETPEGATEWNYWPTSVSEEEILGVETVVDTSQAGFRVTPKYIAHIIGNRILQVGNPFPMVAAELPSFLLVDGFTIIDKSRSTSFVLKVLMPRDLYVGSHKLNPTDVFSNDLLRELTAGLKWHVVWMGIEG